jgi:two-component system, NarL family, response regulator DegU
MKIYRSEFALRLSKTEVNVLNLLCRQFSSYEISNILFLSSKTIENTRYRLLEKTDSKNTAGLVVFAIRNGYFKP